MFEGRGVKGGDGREGVTELNSNDNENGTVLLVNKNYIEKNECTWLPTYILFQLLGVENYWLIKLKGVEQYILC